MAHTAMTTDRCFTLVTLAIDDPDLPQRLTVLADTTEGNIAKDPEVKAAQPVTVTRVK